MFRQHALPFDKSELSLEQTLSVLSERKTRPPSVSDEVWARILEGPPFDEQEVDELGDALHGRGTGRHTAVRTRWEFGLACSFLIRRTWMTRAHF
jgi:hypothetical protein